MKQILKVAAIAAIASACGNSPTQQSPLPLQGNSPMAEMTAVQMPVADMSVAKRADQNPAANPTDLQELVQLAFTESPAVQLRFHRWQQALEQIPQAEALPDPSMNFTTYLQEVETRVGPMDGKIGVSQRLPWFGKLDAAGSQAAALAEVKRAEMKFALLAVRSRIEVAWNQRVFLEESMRITTAQVELLRRVEEIALSQVEVGRASQSHALRAQIERLKMEDRLSTLQNRKLLPESQIDAAVGRPVAHALTWKNAHYAPSVSIPSANDLPQLLETSSPQFQILNAQLRAAGAAREIADLNGMPDFRFGADWTWIGEGNPTMSGSGNDAFSLTLGIEIPLQRSRVHAKRRAALSQQAAVRMDYRRQMQDLLAQATELRFAFEDAERQEALYENSLSPRAENNFSTSLTAYQSGLSSFQDLLDSAQTLLEFRLTTARAHSERADATARFRAFLDLSAHNATSANPPLSASTANESSSSTTPTSTER